MRRLIVLLLVLLPCVGIAQEFSLPEIPVYLQDNNDKSEFLLLHYWDNYDFQNPSILVEGDAVLGYFYLMRDCSCEVSKESIKSTLQKASKKDQIFTLFIETYRTYLFNPESYFCDYERYLAVTEFVINDEKINKHAKCDFLLEKEIIETNKVGEQATNFMVIDKNDNQIELYKINSEYLILFFNNPDCGICMKTKDKLANSTIVNSLIDAGKLKVFSVCPYNGLELWKTTTYPDNWINGYDETQRINNEKLYYFLESSSIYLLDKDKKILKKDIRFDLLEEYLKNL